MEGALSYCLIPHLISFNFLFLLFFYYLGEGEWEANAWFIIISSRRGNMIAIIDSWKMNYFVCVVVVLFAICLTVNGYSNTIGFNPNSEFGKKLAFLGLFKIR